jgi:DNA-binding SARP family transcriptional activator
MAISPPLGHGTGVADRHEDATSMAAAGSSREALPSVSPRVLVCLLGSFRILKDGTPIELRAGGKAEQVLDQLALNVVHGVSRDELLEHVWPASDVALAGQSLNSVAYWLHRKLGDALAGDQPVLHRGGRYWLNTRAGIGVDILEFDAAADAGDRMGRVGDHRSAIVSYDDAVGLYAGDLATGSDIRHLLERERLRARYLTVLAQVADQYFAMADYDLALRYALELLAADPCREDAHRMVMCCHVRLGRRAQALRQYRLCAQILALEFQALPEAATDALMDLVRRQPERV